MGSPRSDTSVGLSHVSYGIASYSAICSGVNIGLDAFEARSARRSSGSGFGLGFLEDLDDFDVLVVFVDFVVLVVFVDFVVLFVAGFEEGLDDFEDDADCAVEDLDDFVVDFEDFDEVLEADFEDFTDFSVPVCPPSAKAISAVCKTNAAMTAAIRMCILRFMRSSWEGR